jgi:hypothetical protein
MNELVNDKDFEDHVMDLIWAPEKELREHLAKYDRQGEVRVTITHELETGRERDIRLNFANRPLPCWHRTAGGYSAYVHIDMQSSDHPKFPELFERMENHIEANTRWDEVANQVAKFLETCKSANEAIKLWPDVARYLPQDVLDKVALKTEKVTKMESAAIAALRAMDMDSINASNVLARMAGATV